MGELITEATVLRWRKKPGERVEKDETILEILTDKVDSEIRSPATGVLAEILAEEGKVVPVKSVIAIISDEAGRTPQRPAQVEQPQPAPAAKVTPQSVLVEPEAEDRADRFYSPLVKSIAAQYGISDYELDSIEGSGAHGRVTKADVMGYIERRANRPAGPIVTVEPARREEPRQPAPVPARTSQPMSPSDNVRIEPLDHVRKRIAEHMVRSKATSPHVYTVAEVDVTNVSKW